MDHYECLELTKNCSQDEIEKSYKRLAFAHHPDRNPGDSKSQSRFLEIQKAYDILRDPVKRADYDSVLNRSSFVNSHGFDWSVFDNVRKWTAHSGVNLDIKIKCNVNIIDSINGGSKHIVFDRVTSCKTCYGSGFSSFENCTNCNGTGMDNKSFMGVWNLGIQCIHCSGFGKKGTKVCSSCFGKKHGSVEKVHLNVTIPKGIKTGMVLCLNGQGNVGASGAGNAYLECNLLADEKYTVDNLDIIFDYEVDYSTLLFGGKIEIATFDNETIELTIPEKTKCATKFRIKGKGIPDINNNSVRGDLVAVTRVKIPSFENSKEVQKVLKSYGL